MQDRFKPKAERREVFRAAIVAAELTGTEVRDFIQDVGKKDMLYNNEQEKNWRQGRMSLKQTSNVARWIGSEDAQFRSQCLAAVTPMSAMAEILTHAIELHMALGDAGEDGRVKARSSRATRRRLIRPAEHGSGPLSLR